MARDVLLMGEPFGGVYAEEASRTAIIGGRAFEESVSGSAYTLSADAGAFALTGRSVSLTEALERIFIGGAPSAPVMVSEENRSFLAAYSVVSGETAVVLPVLTAQAGSFGLAGVSINLQAPTGYQPGVFSLSGAAAGLRYGRNFTAGTGEFSFTLSSVLRSFPAFGAEFAAGFADAGVTYNPVSSKVIAETGALTASGVEVLLRHGYAVAADEGHVDVEWTEASLYQGNRSLTAEPGAFVLTGIPTANKMRILPASFALVMSDADIDLNADTFWTRVDDVAEVWTKVSR